MDARSNAGEPRVLINREALLHNARVIRRVVGADVSVCAVIKADAYGHGASIVVDTLCNYPLDEMGSPPCNLLAAANIDEAMALEEVAVPIMVLRPVENAFVGRQREQIEEAIRKQWILTICSGSAADDIARIAMNLQMRAYVQVMVDTGMSRSGVPQEQFGELVKRLSRHVSLRLFGLCTHFACSEDHAGSFTGEQFELFSYITDPLTSAIRRHGMNIVRHVANSGAVFNNPDTHLDMVRPGLGLYGIAPSCICEPKLNLRPVMKWTANILMIKDIGAGVGVGYGQTWKAQRNSRLALVPVGYADGYSRTWSNKACMMIGGKPAPVVGQVSMDMTMVDVTDITDVNPGDEVVIMDDDPRSPASVYHLAMLGDTIPYEVFCRISSRIHRVAVGEPKLEDAETTPQ